MGRVEIKEQLELLFQASKLELAGFKKSTYANTITELYRKHESALQGIEELYHLENDSEEVLIYLASAFSDCVYKELEGVKKRKKNYMMIDNNLNMVTYVLPLISKREDACMKIFAQKCVDKWNEDFPGFKIQLSTISDINGGFKSGLCYISTAVYENLNQADDCYELTLLRNYRDNYLLHDSEDGQEIINRYYDIAPTIVKRINKEACSKEIYHQIWSEYLQPCVHMIEEGKNEESKKLYSVMVEELASKYFH